MNLEKNSENPFVNVQFACDEEIQRLEEKMQRWHLMQKQFHQQSYVDFLLGRK